MTHRLLKVTSPSGEIRWINLDRVTRVSQAEATDGNPVLVFCFDGQDQITIHGSDDQSRTLIDQVVETLDNLAQPQIFGAAA